MTNTGDKMTETTHAPRSYWIVGARYRRTEDQTPRFLSEGIWENGYDDKHRDLVRSMQPGDRIAIKSSYTRKHNLPFDNRGNTVSVMAIKAIGTVTKNLNEPMNLGALCQLALAAASRAADLTDKPRHLRAIASVILPTPRQFPADRARGAALNGTDHPLTATTFMLGENHATFLAAEVLASSVHRNILCPAGCGWSLET